MLIRISVENFKSFDQREELSMISSNKVRSNVSHRMKIKQTRLLKHAVVYGANASGKSNLISFFIFLKNVLAEGLFPESANYFCRNRSENMDRESFFEIQFTVGEKFYAYGFSALLSQRKMTEEWLYELMQNGNARMLFQRKGDDEISLGETVKRSDAENSRFNIYADDFTGNSTQLFLSEMNRGKRYAQTSHFLFFKETYDWMMKNIIVITPRIGIANVKAYYNDESLENISNLIRTFDTGVTDIKIKEISIDEMKTMVPTEIITDIRIQLRQWIKETGNPDHQMTCRVNDRIFNVKMKGGSEPEITTLVLNHGNSEFDFDFSEESDGTKRLFDLIDLLLTDRPDTVFAVDELERSLHPKLTEHFLRFFMEAHQDVRMQLILTTHEDSIMDQSLFRRDEIWFVERDAENATKMYSLDRFKERYDKKLSKAYLEGRYGAIPVFKQFDFKEEKV